MNVTRRFVSINQELSIDDFAKVRNDIDDFYDEYRVIETNKTLKRAGIATAIGISLIGLISGLALGLKRSGNRFKYKNVTTSKKHPGKNCKKSRKTL